MKGTGTSFNLVGLDKLGRAEKVTRRTVSKPLFSSGIDMAERQNCPYLNLLLKKNTSRSRQQKNTSWQHRLAIVITGDNVLLVLLTHNHVNLKKRRLCGYLDPICQTRKFFRNFGNPLVSMPGGRGTITGSPAVILLV